MGSEISYVITAREHRAAQWLNLKPRRIFLFLGIVIMVLAVWAAWGMWSHDDKLAFAWARWALLLGLVYVVLYGFYLPYQWNRIYRQQSSMRRSVTINIMEKGLEAKDENGKQFMPWSDFGKWKESESVFLLYLSDAMFFIVPTRAFPSENDIVGFRSLLVNALGRSR